MSNQYPLQTSQNSFNYPRDLHQISLKRRNLKLPYIMGFNIQTSCSVQNSGSSLAHWPPVTGYTAWFSCCNDITARFLCCNELPSPFPPGLRVRSPSELVFEKMADNAENQNDKKSKKLWSFWHPEMLRTKLCGLSLYMKGKI